MVLSLWLPVFVCAALLPTLFQVVHALTKDVIARHREEQKRETKNAKIRGTVRRCVDDLLRKVVKSVQSDERAAFRQKQLEERQRRKQEDAQRKRMRQEALRETRYVCVLHATR